MGHRDSGMGFFTVPDALLCLQVDSTLKIRRLYKAEYEQLNLMFVEKFQQHPRLIALKVKTLKDMD